MSHLSLEKDEVYPSYINKSGCLRDKSTNKRYRKIKDF